MIRVLLYSASCLLLASLTGCQRQNDPATKAQEEPQKGSAAASSTCPGTSRSANIAITNPCDRGRVAYRDFVAGTVTDPKAQVWVIVHPQEVGDFWVQPGVTVRDSGEWRVLVYFGEPEHAGKPFEMMAVANPTQPLKEGQLLQSWPDAQWRSNPVDVVRK